MEEKKNNLLVVLLIVFICLTLLLGGFILYRDFFYNNSSNSVTENNNNNIDDNDSSNVNDDANNTEDNKLDSTTDSIANETVLENVAIKNNEVKELYNYVQASLNSSDVCLGYFYQNPFKNHTLEDKISLVLINYAEKFQKEVDDNFLLRISQNDRVFVKTNSTHYINASDIKNGMKLIFNIDVNTFDTNASYRWQYRSDADAFVSIDGGGDYDAKPIQQIIEYNELNNEINLTVAKAEITSDGIYRYVNNPNTLVLKNVTDNFKFTKENVDKFPQLKYIFKKNNAGKYYVSDILNLNFEEDFEKCD